MAARLRRVFGIAVAYWAVVNVNRSLPAGVTSIGLLGVPVFGLLCSAAVLGESWTARCWPAWG